MSNRNFMKLLQAKWDENKFVCLGLDSDFSKIPDFLKAECGNNIRATIIFFNRKIIDATREIVCAYKLNIAFYEEHGTVGLSALFQTIEYVHRVSPDIPIILDAKRADIGNTNNGYVQMAFHYFEADAITVHPYLGKEALEPFLSQKDKGVIVLCRTSNPGAGEFQDLPVPNPVAGSDISTGLDAGVVVAPETIPLYQHVAYNVAHGWNKNGNCLVVAGATYPEELGEVRRLVGDMGILIPAIGKQGGDLEATVKHGKNSKNQGMIINSSRGIIFASDGEDFAEAAREETQELHTNSNQCLKG